MPRKTKHQRKLKKTKTKRIIRGGGRCDFNGEPKKEAKDQGVIKCVNYVNGKSKLVYDKGTYKGYVDENTGLPQGHGVMRYFDKTNENAIYVYVGNWENGEKSGEGKETYKNIDGHKIIEEYTYDGEWKNNNFSGKGTLTQTKYVNNTPNLKYTYVGNWENGEKSGEGKETSLELTHNNTIIQETTYIGKWENDKSNGEGTLTIMNYNNGKVTKKYTGLFKDDKKINGTETYISGGITYEATFEDGVSTNYVKKN